MNTESLTPDATHLQSIDEVVNSHLFFSGLTPKQLQTLRENAMLVHYRPGEVIFREGDPANRFYLIHNGRVLLESPRLDKDPVPVQIIGPGDVVGWSWLFPPYYWQFSARAVEPTTAVFFYGTRLREQCEVDHELGYELLKRMTRVVIHRLQSVRSQLSQAKESAGAIPARD